MLSIMVYWSLSFLGLTSHPVYFTGFFCFLTGRTQQVKYATKLSAFQPINIGIVQGSGLGPTLFIVMESDLKTISKINILLKYADDNNLLVPEKPILTFVSSLLTLFNGLLITQ